MPGEIPQPAPESVYDKFKAKLVALKDSIKSNADLETQKEALKAEFIKDLNEAKVPATEHEQRWNEAWGKVLTSASFETIRDDKLENSLEQANIDAFISDSTNLTALPALENSPANKINNFFTEKLGKIEEKLGWEPGTLASIFNGLPGLALAIRAFGAPKPGEKPSFFTVICDNIANALDPVGAEGRKKLEEQKGKVAKLFEDKKTVIPNLADIDKVEIDLKGDPTKNYDKFEALATTAIADGSDYRRITKEALDGPPTGTIIFTANDVSKIENLDKESVDLIEKVLKGQDTPYYIDQTDPKKVREFLNAAYGITKDSTQAIDNDNFKKKEVKPTVVASAAPAAATPAAQ